MKCKCCGSDRQTTQSINSIEYASCTRCGFMSAANSAKDRILNHYRDHDPHERVAVSKRAFFESAISYLSAHGPDGHRSILDIGCGFGYFLEYAATRGWTPFGVEIVENAATFARERIGSHQIYHGSLRAAEYPGDMFHAITAWDVLFHMDDPLTELKECWRIMKPGGRIGIRVRNVLFEKAIYYGYRKIQPVAGKIGMKRPYVFHTCCFSPESLRYLLHQAGFEIVRIQNSPLTKGDPYAYTPFTWFTASSKIIIDTLTKRLFSFSNGRWILGPSLLVWARKPRARSGRKPAGANVLEADTAFRRPLTPPGSLLHRISASPRS